MLHLHAGMHKRDAWGWHCPLPDPSCKDLPVRFAMSNSSRGAVAKIKDVFIWFIFVLSKYIKIPMTRWVWEGMFWPLILSFRIWRWFYDCLSPGQHPGMTISDNRSDTCWVRVWEGFHWAGTRFYRQIGRVQPLLVTTFPMFAGDMQGPDVWQEPKT